MKTTVRKHQIQLCQPSVAVQQEIRRLSRAGSWLGPLHTTCPLQQQGPALGLISSFSSVELLLLQPHDTHLKVAYLLGCHLLPSCQSHCNILWISTFIYAGLLLLLSFINAAATWLSLNIASTNKGLIKNQKLSL